ncbi:rod shape-determining protein MreC [Sphingobacterium alimentarium]|uniref:Cell shape-determining protein MreC n=1 Tax=Sphingobacterium alimentarium TaxID=797292 RepID=A0A4R3VQN9_9SPHI|nr:rod shape-determining protein MreC [Sphingobacterium alimentarium]TCV09604.1 rod shape-determining protein MreC [Sphingobacterium alimentarium]
MKNLWLFLVRYNSVFWFILFFVFSLVLVINNNQYQRSSFVNSSNIVVGSFYTKVNSWKEYMHLTEVNKDLLDENALLRYQLQQVTGNDTSKLTALSDSIENPSNYDFIVASVVNNSVHLKKNYITVNKGSLDGIEKDMGVITSNGVVGTVMHVSNHFSTVKSLLHPDTKISVSIDSTASAFGSLVWGENTEPRFAMVRDIPNHVKLYVGQPIYTSGYSTKFPKGIKVGYIVQTDIVTGGSFKDVRILLTTKFEKLTHVYIVKDKLAQEKIELESLNDNNG